MSRVDWIGYKEVDKFTISDKEGMWSEVLSRLKDGRILITFTDKATRSSAQNRYLHGVAYKAISETTGYTTEEVHEICKAKFLAHTIHIGEEDMDIPKSTTKLTTDEFSEYVEAIKRWAAETLDCYIPDAGEI